MEYLGTTLLIYTRDHEDLVTSIANGYCEYITWIL